MREHKLTILLYLEDSYLKEFSAKVNRTIPKKNALILDKTAYYPRGGGQPSDKGTLSLSKGTASVKEVVKEGIRVIHFLEEFETFPEKGSSVHGSLDWNRRYAFMKYHTTQHILSAIILERYGASTTGNQFYEEYGYMDFDIPTFKGKVAEIEDEMNSIIKKNLQVNIYSVSREEANSSLDPKRVRLHLIPKNISIIRIVEIPSIDVVACGGTHVKQLGELGSFNIIKLKSKGKGRRRITFTLN